MSSRGSERLEQLKALAARVERSMHEFECGAKGTSRSPDGLVRINVTPSGECAIRINPHDAEREQLEDQIRQTFNSAVRRMSRNVAAADPLSLFESPDER